jgi:copper chaperone for superoxide dismutase
VAAVLFLKSLKVYPISNGQIYYEDGISGVCCLEYTNSGELLPSGLVRIIQLKKDDCLFDAVVDNCEPNEEYTISVHEYGDFSGEELDNCGEVLVKVGAILADGNGRGSILVEQVRADLSQLIGRSICLTETRTQTRKIAGIIARSSRAFSNEKKICTCSGKTLWEESVLNKHGI